MGRTCTFSVIVGFFSRQSESVGHHNNGVWCTTKALVKSSTVEGPAGEHLSTYPYTDQIRADRECRKCFKSFLRHRLETCKSFRLTSHQIGRKLKGLRLDSNDFSNATIAFRHTWQDLDKVVHSVRTLLPGRLNW